MLGLPGPAGELKHSPDPLAAMRVLTSKGRERKGGGLLIRGGEGGEGLLLRETEGKEGSEGWRQGTEKQGNGIPPKTS